MSGKSAAKKDEVKRYRVTGLQAPIRIDLPKGGYKIYEEGDEFVQSEWPMPHVTIPNQLKLGTIKEVK